MSTYLFGFFDFVFLIDADAICPKKARLLGEAEPDKGGMEVAGDGKWFIFDGNGVG